MNNFKPGDKAVYVGPPYSLTTPNEFPVKYGEEVMLGSQIQSPIDGSVAFRLCDGYGRWRRCNTRVFNLRKPNDYDITAQDWYQRILRGEQVEETV